MSKVGKVIAIYRRYGLRGFLNKLSEKLQAPYRDYDKRVSEFLPAAEDLKEQRILQETFSSRPLISIVVPLYETRSVFLRELLDSIRLQTYPKWELVLADGSRSNQTEEQVRTYQRNHPDFGVGENAVRYRRLPENGGISANTNEGLKDATGELIAFMDHDDLLTENALFEVVRAWNEQPEEKRCRLFYTDEDKADETITHFSQPHFKKDFNLELLRTNNYICHFLVLEKTLLQQIEGFRSAYDGSQDYDLILRAVEALVFPEGHYDPAGSSLICHIPKICYHWRMHAASTAGDSASKTYTASAGQRAVEDHYARLGIAAKVEERIEVGCFKLTYPPVSDDSETSGEVRVLLSDTLKPRDPDWKEKLIATCMQEGVGAVYGKIYDKDGRVVEAGVENAPDGTLQPQFAGLPGTFKGYERRAVVKQETSAYDPRFAVIRESVLAQPGARIIFDPDVEADQI